MPDSANTTDRHGWSEDAIVTALRRCAAELGESPSQSQYREWRDGPEPAAKSAINCFGTWNDAKHAAGLETYAPGTHPNYRLVEVPRCKCVERLEERGRDD